MAEQLLDLRQSLGALRRYRLALAGTVLLGAAAGATLSSVQPPTYTSSSQVLLPQLAVGGQLINRDPASESRVAGSAVVLERAGKQLDPKLSAGEVRQLVSVGSPGDNVIEYTAHSQDPVLAKDAAQAAAEAEVDYIADGANEIVRKQMDDINARLKTQQAHYADYSNERQAVTARMRTQTGALRMQTANRRTALIDDLAQVSDAINEIQKERSDLAKDSVTAQVIQPATAAAKPGELRRGALFGLVGAGIAVVLAALLLVVIAGRDRRLRGRDAIADAAGSPVLGAVTSATPHSLAGWSGLLGGYEPAATDAWSLRQVLRRVTDPSGPGEGSAAQRLTVLTLAGDTAGLAVAVQLASYASTTGLRTRLVPAGEMPLATLAAAFRQAHGAEPRPGLHVGTGPEGEPGLTATLAVLDRKDPLAPSTADATLLVVSAGAATAEDLARAALAVDDAGSRIVGILVADPDDLDHTTGRLEAADRSSVRGPDRTTGVSSLSFGAVRGGRGR